MITLTNTVSSESLTLPDLVWTDEFAFSTVASSARRSIGGFLIRDYSLVTGGRPITLAGAADSGWIKRSDVATLRSWLDDIDATFMLDIHGQEFECEFDRSRNPPIDLAHVIDYSDPSDDDFYYGTLKFITL